MEINVSLELKAGGGKYQVWGCLSNDKNQLEEADETLVNLLRQHADLQRDRTGILKHNLETQAPHKTQNI